MLSERASRDSCLMALVLIRRLPPRLLNFNERCKSEAVYYCKEGFCGLVNTSQPKADNKYIYDINVKKTVV